MKNKKLLTLLLLVVMSFQVVHAYAFDILDTHACSVDEYVVEFSQPVNFDDPNDICNIHSEFHISFLIPEHIELAQTLFISQKPYALLKSYDYDAPQTFLIPPKHS